jgi:hypothetical protein
MRIPWSKFEALLGNYPIAQLKTTGPFTNLRLALGRLDTPEYRPSAWPCSATGLTRLKAALPEGDRRLTSGWASAAALRRERQLLLLWAAVVFWAKIVYNDGIEECLH